MLLIINNKYIYTYNAEYCKNYRKIKQNITLKKTCTFEVCKMSRTIFPLTEFYKLHSVFYFKSLDHKSYRKKQNKYA